MASRYKKQVSLGYAPDGKRVRKWIRADSQQELKRKERELLMEADKELQSKMRFGDYAQKWFKTYKTNKEPGTRYMYEYTLRKLSPLNNIPLKDITRSDVQSLINEYKDRPNSAQKLAMTIRQILESAAADNLIAPKYMKIDLPKNQKREKRALTASEKEAVKKAELTPIERLFVDIELYLGLRPEETRALTPHDFDLKAKTVTISKACAFDLSTNQPIIKQTKTGKVRTLPVPDVLIREIRAYNAKFQGFYYFVDKEGTLLTYGKYKSFMDRIFAKINEALGGTDKLNLLNGMTMYTFRHNRATELYYLPGISTKKKAEYMGHSEIMFLRTYSHLDESKEDDELLRKVL